jgi:hypothetical protein
MSKAEIDFNPTRQEWAGESEEQQKRDQRREGYRRTSQSYDHNPGSSSVIRGPDVSRGKGMGCVIIDAGVVSQ